MNCIICLEQKAFDCFESSIQCPEDLDHLICTECVVELIRSNLESATPILRYDCPGISFNTQTYVNRPCNHTLSLRKELWHLISNHQHNLLSSFYHATHLQSIEDSNSSHNFEFHCNVCNTKLMISRENQPIPLFVSCNLHNDRRWHEAQKIFQYLDNHQLREYNPGWKDLPDHILNVIEHTSTHIFPNESDLYRIADWTVASKWKQQTSIIQNHYLIQSNTKLFDKYFSMNGRTPHVLPMPAKFRGGEIFGNLFDAMSVTDCFATRSIELESLSIKNHCLTQFSVKDMERVIRLALQDIAYHERKPQCDISTLLLRWVQNNIQEEIIPEYQSDSFCLASTKHFSSVICPIWMNLFYRSCIKEFSSLELNLARRSQIKNTIYFYTCLVHTLYQKEFIETSSLSPFNQSDVFESNEATKASHRYRELIFMKSIVIRDIGAWDSIVLSKHKVHWRFPVRVFVAALLKRLWLCQDNKLPWTATKLDDERVNVNLLNPVQQFIIKWLYSTQIKSDVEKLYKDCEFEIQSLLRGDHLNSECMFTCCGSSSLLCTGCGVSIGKDQPEVLEIHYNRCYQPKGLHRKSKTDQFEFSFEETSDLFSLQASIESYLIDMKPHCPNKNNPLCGEVVEKIGDCNEITCNRCSSLFCFVCNHPFARNGREYHEAQNKGSSRFAQLLVMNKDKNSPQLINLPTQSISAPNSEHHHFVSAFFPDDSPYEHNPTNPRRSNCQCPKYMNFYYEGPYQNLHRPAFYKWYAKYKDELYHYENVADLWKRYKVDELEGCLARLFIARRHIQALRSVVSQLELAKASHYFDASWSLDDLMTRLIAIAPACYMQPFVILEWQNWFHVSIVSKVVDQIKPTLNEDVLWSIVTTPYGAFFIEPTPNLSRKRLRIPNENVHSFTTPNTPARKRPMITQSSNPFNRSRIISSTPNTPQNQTQVHLERVVDENASTQPIDNVDFESVNELLPVRHNSSVSTVVIETEEDLIETETSDEQHVSEEMYRVEILCLHFLHTFHFMATRNTTIGDLRILVQQIYIELMGTTEETIVFNLWDDNVLLNPAKDLQLVHTLVRRTQSSITLQAF